MTMSQTHKSPIYMKYFKLLLLFLFISVQNATATYVKYKYSSFGLERFRMYSAYQRHGLSIHGDA